MPAQIDVKPGNPLNGYDAEANVSTPAEATVWLRDQACRHCPDSEFARKYGGFFWSPVARKFLEKTAADPNRNRRQGTADQGGLMKTAAWI
jgi:hypothetical protein